MNLVKYHEPVRNQTSIGNRTSNCPKGQKRNIANNECVLAAPIHLNSQSSASHAFHPHEPYINDMNPIAAIQQINQIGWIDDDQPIEPIESEDFRRTIQNSIEVSVRGKHLKDGREKRGNKKEITNGIRERKGNIDSLSDRQLEEISSNLKQKRYISSKAVSSTNGQDLNRLQIAPLKLGTIFSNFLRRRLKERLKLYNLSAAERGGMQRK